MVTPMKRFGIPRKSTPVYDLKCLSTTERAQYESLPNHVERARFLNGSGQAMRPPFDCPSYSEIHGQEIVLGGPKVGAGNSWIVMGLDHTGFAQGWGSKQSSHCSAIDIVAGRMGFTAASKELDGTPIIAEPNFKDDAARIYLSQRCGIDAALGLKHPGLNKKTSARSAVAVKADLIRIVARENIKFITRTDTYNSQGGVLGDAWKGGYGIDLIAMNDKDTLQPMVKGNNLVLCLSHYADLFQTILSILNTYINETRKIHEKVIPHTHKTAFYGNDSAPDFGGVLPAGIKVMINNITKADVGIQQLQQALLSMRTTYLEATGIETVDKKGKSLSILSPYNSNN